MPKPPERRFTIINRRMPGFPALPTLHVTALPSNHIRQTLFAVLQGLFPNGARDSHDDTLVLTDTEDAIFHGDLYRQQVLVERICTLWTSLQIS